VACDSAAGDALPRHHHALDQTEGYCLAQVEAEGWLLVPGAGQFRGRCTKTVCDRVNSWPEEGTSVASRSWAFAYRPPGAVRDTAAVLQWRTVTGA
jgi:hypothetical protein